MHNAAFQALGLDGRYDALPTPPERLAEAVAAVAAAGYRGINVTIPHKQTVMPLLDELSAAAQAVGAVNTISVDPVNGIHRLTRQRPLRAWEADPSSAPEGALRGQPGIEIPGHDAVLRGDNTDWLGFLHPLDAAGFDLAGKSALLLGAGGSARAVVYALLQRGLTHLAIWARTPARAAELAHHAQTLSPSLSINYSPFTTPALRAGASVSHSPHLIINTTPLGMWPHIDASPWPIDLPIPAGALVYDLVYRPERTLFLQRAEAAGCATQGGLEMLVVQGAAAFELWTGQKPPLEVMMAAARAALTLERMI
jgi:shikimate dehydrogenase